jgi:hypothetical protein
MAITLNGVAGVSANQVANDALTFTNKTLSLGDNTVTGTLAQFNTAITDGNVPNEILVLMGAL